MNTSPRHLDAIILAAGKGTRMNSDLPKVLHPVAGRPMVQWVIDACRAAGARRCIVVVGYEADRVRRALEGEAGVLFVEQTQQLGTGHAAMMAQPCFDHENNSDVLVVAGDMPLLEGSTLGSLVEAHRRAGAAGTLATSTFDDPPHYGRIIRDAQGQFLEIVEHKDATEAQRQIKELNISCYCFESRAMFEALAKVRTDNAQGEYYLTDVLGIMRRDGQVVQAIDTVPPQEAMGVNDPKQLAQVDTLLRDRLGNNIHSSSQA